MREYLAADEVAEVAQSHVLPRWHQGLQGASIAFLFDEKGLTERGKDVYAKIRKATAVETHFTGYELVLIVSRAGVGCVQREATHCPARPRVLPCRGRRDGRRRGCLPHGGA